MSRQTVKKKAADMDAFFTLLFRTGAIFNQITEERMQVVPVLHWKKLEANLTREFHEEASLIMSLIGSTLGSTIAEQMMNDLADPEAFTRHLSDMLAAAGWGVFSIHGDTRYGTHYVVSVANCGFCDTEDLADSPRCHFLVAAMKGVADTLYGTPHRASEKRCGADGDSVCEVVVDECAAADSACTECSVSRFCDFASKNARRDARHRRGFGRIPIGST